MVSLDKPEKNKAFADSVGAGFVLLSDPGKENAEKYGVLALGGLYTRRWTFYIDARGTLLHIDKDVKPSSHGGDVVAQLRALGMAGGEAAPMSSQTP
jgi:peroxiredoxin